MGQGLLIDIFIIIWLSIFVVLLFNKLRIPSIVGFLLTGLIVGPYGLKLITDESQVQIISEIGVILLLFSIGIEFSLSKLLSIKRNVFVGGGLQVGISMLIALLLPTFTSFTINQSIFIGFLISLSSTALIMKLLYNTGGTDSPQGRVSLSISIFQDLSILPMILIVPLLIGGKIDMTTELLILAAKMVGIGSFVFVSIKYIMPKLIFQVAKTRIKELFILSILGVCGVTVWLSSLSGISLALGAFLAGLIVSETEYSHEALSKIEPFKEVFASFFFVSIGMLLNLNFLLSNFTLISLVVIAVIVVKFVSAGIATYTLTASLRIAIITGVLIAQIGEYGFVFALVGIEGGLLDEFTYQIFLAVTVMTIILNPILLQIANKISQDMANSESPRKLGFEEESKNCFKGHLIIIGFGLNGRNLAKAAKFANIPYVIIEMNPVTVRDERKNGEIVIFGDATNEAVLEMACIADAKIVVSTIPDPIGERAIALSIKRMNPNVFLIIRTRYDSEMEPLYSLGADEVIPEEFETSIEIFTRVLARYSVPINDIQKFTNKIRGNRYQMFRKISEKNKHSRFLSKLSGHRTYSIRIRANSFLAGKTLLDANLRENYSLTILAIQRKDDVISNPPPNFLLQRNDIVLLFGASDTIDKVTKLIN